MEKQAGLIAAVVSKGFIVSFWIMFILWLTFGFDNAGKILHYIVVVEIGLMAISIPLHWFQTDEEVAAIEEEANKHNKLRNFQTLNGVLIVVALLLVEAYSTASLYGIFFVLSRLVTHYRSKSLKNKS